MKSSFEDFQKDWKKAQASHPQQGLSSAEIIDKSKLEIRNSRLAQRWNIVILSFTLIGISAFFYFLAPVQETISQIGVALMVAGLLIRIIVELVSLRKSNQLRTDLPAADLTAATFTYHAYRKKIHGGFTASILIAYVIGILILVPEFSLYLSKSAMITIGITSILGILIVGYSIRKGIRDEMRILHRLKELQQSIDE